MTQHHYHGQPLAINQLVRDEKGKLSSARTLLWLISVPLLLLCIVIDIGLTLTHAPATLPNNVYAILGTVFLCSAGWAAGKGFAASWGSAGSLAGAMASAVRDIRLPSRLDDERHDGRE